MKRRLVLSRLSLPVAAVAVVALGGCAAPPAPRQLDLGPAPTAMPATLARPVQLQGISAPSWLSGTGVAYRLDALAPQQRQHYRDSRWVAPPAELLAERLRQRIAAAGARPGPVLALRLELEECLQHFASPQQAELLLRLRASTDQGRQQVFEQRLPTPSADAPGAAQALARAADALNEAVLAWATQGG
jgi:ABC-type uncharacterized transport system auxiliary subunit